MKEETTTDVSKRKIADAVRNSDYELKLETPTRVTFNYIDDNGCEADDEVNAVSLKYYPIEGEIYVVTDEDYYEEIPLDALWNSSIEAIANFSI